MLRLITLILAMTAATYAWAGTSQPKSLKEKVEVAQAIPDKININKANVQQLQSLPGIGRKKADAILKFREENGPFTSVKSLSMVKGIGDKMVLKLADKATI